MLNVDILIEFVRFRILWSKKNIYIYINKYENNVKAFVTLSVQEEERSVSDRFWRKKRKSDFYIDVFQEYELFMFFRMVLSW